MLALLLEYFRSAVLIQPVILDPGRSVQYVCDLDHLLAAEREYVHN